MITNLFDPEVVRVTIHRNELDPVVDVLEAETLVEGARKGLSQYVTDGVKDDAASIEVTEDGDNPKLGVARKRFLSLEYEAYDPVVVSARNQDGEEIFPVLGLIRSDTDQ